MRLSKPLLRIYITDTNKELEQLVKDIGGCDHAVGICCCGTIRLIEDGKVLLQQLQ